MFLSTRPHNHQFKLKQKFKQTQILKILQSKQSYKKQVLIFLTKLVRNRVFTLASIHTPLQLLFVDVKPLLQKKKKRLHHQQKQPKRCHFINKQKRIAKRHYNFGFDTVIVRINTCTSQPHCKTKKKPQQHIYISHKGTNFSIL